jgi:hypothetical protein
LLYTVALFQIGIYLVGVPMLRIALEQKSAGDYDFVLASIAIMAFILGAALCRSRFGTNVTEKMHIRLSSTGIWIWCIWSIAYCLISIELGLTNRRIGTEVAAELFASFPLWALATFRVYEVMTPIILAALILDQPKRMISRVGLLLSVLAFAMGGAIFSRSAVALLILLLLIFLQNSFRASQIRLIAVTGIALGVIVGSVVTLNRATIQGTDLDTSFFGREFFERLDGLEVVSLISSEFGTFSMGIQPQIIAVPVIVALSFLPGAAELKAAATTTIKSMILADYLDSDFRDINSFYVLDAYYTGGLPLVVISSMIVGALARTVDKRIGRKGAHAAQCLMVAASINFVMLEREFVGMLLGTLRDWFLIYVFLKVLSRSGFSKLNVKSNSRI